MKQYEKKQDIIEGLVEQLDSPVLFYQTTLKLLKEQNVQDFYECGPFGILQKFISDTAKSLDLKDVKIQSFN